MLMTLKMKMARMIRAMLVNYSTPKASLGLAAATLKRSSAAKRALWIMRMEITWMTPLTMSLVTIAMHLMHIRTHTSANCIRKPHKKVTRQTRHVQLALVVKRKGTRGETILRTRKKSKKS